MGLRLVEPETVDGENVRGCSYRGVDGDFVFTLSLRATRYERSLWRSGSRMADRAKVSGGRAIRAVPDGEVGGGALSKTVENGRFVLLRRSNLYVHFAYSVGRTKGDTRRDDGEQVQRRAITLAGQVATGMEDAGRYATFP